jgi:hypothetical protein
MLSIKNVNRSLAFCDLFLQVLMAVSSCIRGEHYMSSPSTDHSETTFLVAWPRRFSEEPPFLGLYYEARFLAVGAYEVPFLALAGYYSDAPDRSADFAVLSRCFAFNIS